MPLHFGVMGIASATVDLARCGRGQTEERDGAGIMRTRAPVARPEGAAAHGWTAFGTRRR